MRKLLLFAVALVFFSAAILSSREASAVPAFARQTGMACNTCHFQHFPTLNSFGRAFKSGGYTQIGGQSLIEGDFLSLPSTLNASLITKIRFQKRNGDAQTGGDAELNKGQLQFPDEAAIFLGGRAGEHIGFLLEASLKDGDPLFTSFKLPIVFKVAETDLNVIPFTTDAAGVAYGFELFNTGAVRMIRPVEHRTQTSAQQYIGTDGKATGLAFAASHKLGFVNYSLWTNEHALNADNQNTISFGPPLHYIRGAFTPTVSGWDLGAGFQVWTGSSKSISNNGVEVRSKADAWGIDAQAQGEVGKFPLGVYFTYASAAKSGAGETANIFNSNTADDKTAYTLTGELGVIPHKLTTILAYRNANTGAGGSDSDDAITIGFSYEPVQNVDIQLNHTWHTGDAVSPSTGKNLSTLMLFAAF